MTNFNMVFKTKQKTEKPHVCLHVPLTKREDHKMRAGMTYDRDAQFPLSCLAGFISRLSYKLLPWNLACMNHDVASMCAPSIGRTSSQRIRVLALAVGGR